MKLTGEAFFEVQKDPEHRFIVSGPHHTQIEVLGTSFNVEAFERDSFISTTLVEGKVRFAYQKNRQPATVDMKPGQKLMYDTTSSQVKLIQTSGETETAWKDGKIIFQATPLPEALRMLEKRFNVTFVLSNNRLRGEAFNGSFTNQRLERILEIFKISSNIKWRYLDTQELMRERELKSINLIWKNHGKQSTLKKNIRRNIGVFHRMERLNLKRLFGDKQ